MSTRRFRIAFSFAGEIRDFVKQTADLLSDRFGQGAILYDKYHEAEFAVYDLGIKLPKLYGEESDLIVPVLSPNYDVKRWTGWEWVHIYGLLTKVDGHRIMPSRFKYASADGLSPASGFIELDNKTPEHFVTLILERLAINEGRAKDYYTKGPTGAQHRAPAAVPNNLPRLQYFFGRDAELKRIADALAPDARGWGALIDGPGGIGKTALAIHAAQLVPADRFRRIIFLSAKERELTADGQRALGTFVLPTCFEMLNAIARELEQPEIVKSPETERPELILRALRDENVLLVLDNLETLPTPDRDQIFALLNRLPSGTSAIVTSRRRADAGAVSVRLDRLDWDAARALIAEIEKDFPRLEQASEPDRRAIYDETGGNPLLIRWVAGQLGRGRYRDLAAVLGLLRSPEAGNNPLEFVFGDLLDTFSVPETKVLAALTHFTLPIEVKFIAELGGINQAAAQGALADLSSRALVMPDSEERCFHIVPLVADFLRKKKPEVVAETGDRLEKRAYTLIIENAYEKYERFPTLEAAWPGIAPALPFFLVGNNMRLQIVCNALRTFLYVQGYWDEVLAFCEKAEARAVANGDYHNAGWRAFEVGFIHSVRHQTDALLTCSARAADHWQRAEAGSRERASDFRLRGDAHRLKKDYPAAIASYRESLELHRGLAAVSLDVSTGLMALGNTEFLSGDLAKAEEHYLEALHVARTLDHATSVATCNGSLVSLAIQRKDWPAAERLAREALPLSESVNIVAFLNYGLSFGLVRQGKIAEALPHARRAVEIYTRLGHPSLTGAQAILTECGG
ncbi:Orc1-like, AAA ATPase domain containing protein [Fimbriimonadaceae bacterium]